MEDTDLQLVEKAFDASTPGSSPPDRLAFRAAHAEHLEGLDELERIGYLKVEGGRYVVSVTVLSRFRTARARAILGAAEAVFDYLKREYVKDQRRLVPVDELASKLKIDRERVVEVLNYMIEYSWWGGRAIELSAPDAYVIAGEAALRLKTFDEAIELLRGWQLDRVRSPEVVANSAHSAPNQMPARDTRKDPHAQPAIRSHPLFIFGQDCGLEEGVSVELKEVNGNPIRAISEASDEYAVGFLNSEGGTIYWGVRDSDSKVTGVELDRSNRDRLKQVVTGKLNAIQPALPATHWRLTLHPLECEGKDRFVISLTVPPITTSAPFFTSGGDAFVRLDGINQKLKGPQLTSWMRARWPPETARRSDTVVLSPEHSAHAKRFRQMLRESGIEPAHLARFLSSMQAPFSCTLSDLATDHSLLFWLDDQKSDWFAKLFRIRREWLDGEEGWLYEHAHYDKNTGGFWSDVQQAKARFSQCGEMKIAYFIRAGRGKDWERRGDTAIYVVIAVPMLSLSSERVICHYSTDCSPYPWNYDRTQIQLRAWARLLFADGFVVLCKECDLEVAELIAGGNQFMWSLIESQALRPVDWHIDDYALGRAESMVAKDEQNLPLVLEHIRSAGLEDVGRGIHRLPGAQTSAVVIRSSRLED